MKESFEENITSQEHEDGLDVPAATSASSHAGVGLARRQPNWVIVRVPRSVASTVLALAGVLPHDINYIMREHSLLDDDGNLTESLYDAARKVFNFSVMLSYSRDADLRAEIEKQIAGLANTPVVDIGHVPDVTPIPVLGDEGVGDKDLKEGDFRRVTACTLAAFADNVQKIMRKSQPEVQVIEGRSLDCHDPFAEEESAKPEHDGAVSVMLKSVVARVSGLMSGFRNNKAEKKDATRSSAQPDRKKEQSRAPAQPAKKSWKKGFAYGVLGVFALIGFVAVIAIEMLSGLGKSSAPASQKAASAQSALTSGFNAASQPGQAAKSADMSQPQKTAPVAADSRIEVVMGGGEKKLFVFTDPACPFCKKLEPMLESVADKDEAEIHVFPTPVHQESFDMIASLACENQKKRVSAWERLINTGRIAAKPDCENARGVNDRAVTFFAQFGFNATPTLVNSAGLIHVGAFQTEEELVAFINAKKQ
jgi:thiol-disulfide isomerase/thioredoxin